MRIKGIKLSCFSYSGDFVVIGEGQTMLLDMDTPKLKFLLIKGGTFIFDNKDIQLHAEHILILENGTFLIGSKEERFQHQACITLHGHVRSKELPVYGAKSFSLRTGYLGLFGRHIMNTWTRIDDTLEPGATEMSVLNSVADWGIGSEIVVATTSKSLRENEVLNITGISSDGMRIYFTPSLKYKHISIVQNIEGHIIETRAEVGLLTRNVKIQGSRHDEWDGIIEACPKEFDPDQFAQQTCFDGAFGEERGSDQFGVQIMVHSHKEGHDKGLAVAHFDHIEVTHAGQAFRLGRYPIHFHMEGDVHGSYVVGCSIHRTFNRAVTMHGIDNLRVERNVIYDIMGKKWY